MQFRSTLDIVALNQLNVLIQLAQADHDFADAERDMIYRIGREKNFPEERLNRLVQKTQCLSVPWERCLLIRNSNTCSTVLS